MTETWKEALGKNGFDDFLVIKGTREGNVEMTLYGQINKIINQELATLFSRIEQEAKKTTFGTDSGHPKIKGTMIAMDYFMFMEKLSTLRSEYGVKEDM